MKGKKLIIYTCFSVLIVLLSFVIYYGFSDVEKTEIQNTAFAFTVIAEVIFFGMTYVLTREEVNAFTRAGIGSISVIYLLVSLILNILIKAVFQTVRTLIVTNVIVLIIYIAIILTIYLFKKEK